MTCEDQNIEPLDKDRLALTFGKYTTEETCIVYIPTSVIEDDDRLRTLDRVSSLVMKFVVAHGLFPCECD